MSNDAVTAQARQTVSGAGGSVVTLMSQIVFAALKPVFNSKIYPQVAPDSVVAPFGVYLCISQNAENTFNDGSTIENYRFQVDIYSATYDEAHRLALSARSAMLAIAQPISTLFSMQADEYEPEVKLHRVVQDYSLWQPRS